MVTEDQTAVIDFLSSPAAHGGLPVERVDTHTAVVFLAGNRALKLKRAVRFDYVDFSTRDRRRAMCEAEVQLNRRTAPTLYVGVTAVTRAPDGTLAIEGDDPAVEWLVVMRRFDQDALLDRLAAANRLGLQVMPPLAAAVAAFHASAETKTNHGGLAGMAWVIDGNAAGLAEFAAGHVDTAAGDRVISRSRAVLGRHGALLEARRQAGFVRHCHGDLHLRNIVLLDGAPTLFDGVEFNDEIACTDVLYDLAFLLMDLWRRRLPRHANAVWNRYLAETGEIEGLSLLPLFLSCRAAVRAKTSATAATVQDDDATRAGLYRLAREYLEMAETLLTPPRAVLVAVAGRSGSGKSTLAYDLAPSLGAVPGAIVLRSDEIRKHLAGVATTERLDETGYSREMSRRVYDALVERGMSIARQGHSVVLDATWLESSERAAVERAAHEASIPFVGFWLDAPEALLVARAEQRRHDASDANAQVVRRQHTQQPGPIGWTRLDASQPPERVLEDARAHLRDRPPELFAR